MRFLTLNFILGIVLVLNGMCFARDTSPTSCVSFAEASKHGGHSPVRQRHRAARGRWPQRRQAPELLQRGSSMSFTVVVFPPISRRWATFANSKGGRLKSRGRFRITTGGRRSFCAAPTTGRRGLPAVSHRAHRLRRRARSAPCHRLDPRQGAKKETTKQSDPMSIEEAGEP